ncbi:hypothetical protein LguiB_000389 [Lonicera macranthoides]
MSSEEGYGSTSDNEDNRKVVNVESKIPPFIYLQNQCLKCNRVFSTRGQLMHHLDLRYGGANNPTKKPICEFNLSPFTSNVGTELNLFPDPLDLTLAPPTSLALNVAIENHATRRHRPKKRENRAEVNVDNSDLLCDGEIVGLIRLGYNAIEEDFKFLGLFFEVSGIGEKAKKTYGSAIALHKKLQTVSQKVDVETLCPFCEQEQESAYHLFVQCSVSVQVWAEAGLVLPQPHDPYL